MVQVTGRQAQFEKFATETLLIYIGGSIFLIGWLVFAPFTPNWQWNLGPAAIWTVLGALLLFGGLAVWGLASSFRHHTRKLIAGNDMFQIAFPNAKTVDVVKYGVDEGGIANLSTVEREKAVAAQSSVPGTNSRGKVVRTSILLPGGIDAHGFKSFEGGSQGMIVLDGDDQVIKLDECLFIPYVLEPRDHTEVPVEVLVAAEDQSHFVRGKSPIYTVGALDPRIHEWLATKPVPQSVVLQSIGFDGLVDRFVGRLNKLAQSGRLPALNPTGKRLPPEFLKAVHTEVAAWLHNQQTIAPVLGDGTADREYYRQRYYSILSQFNIAQSRIRTKDDTILEADKAVRGRWNHEARVWNNGPRSAGPGYDLADRRPSVPQTNE